MLAKTGVDPATKYRCPWIEGYCSHTSVRAGETIRFYVSTNPAAQFTLDIYRMGYYGGNGGRLVERCPLASVFVILLVPLVWYVGRRRTK